MNKPELKTCEFCGNDRPTEPFAENMAVCFQCLYGLPATVPKCRLMILRLKQEIARLKPDTLPENEQLVTVCDSCLQASCLNGEFMCDEAKAAMPEWLAAFRAYILQGDQQNLIDSKEVNK